MKKSNPSSEVTDVADAAQAGVEVVTQGRQRQAVLATRGEELINKAQGLLARIERTFWEVGRVLVSIRDESLHRALGYDNLEVLARERLGLSKTVAWKLLSVAEVLPRDEAVKLGQEKAYALIAYARAAPDQDPTVLIQEDAAIAGKPLSETTVRDLEAATAAARPKRPLTLAAARQKREDRELLLALRERLRSVGIPKSAVEVGSQGFVITLSRPHARRLVGD